jgi:prephenate dehydrogenase
VVFVANPNNPTGTWLPPDALRSFIAAVPPQVLVVLDEAYNEYLEPASAGARDALDRRISAPHRVALVLEGLRSGRAAHRLRRDGCRGGGHAQSRAPAVQRQCARAGGRDRGAGDTDYVEESRRLNREGLAQLARGFERLGVTALPSHGNFALAKVGDAVRVYWRAAEGRRHRAPGRQLRDCRNGCASPSDCRRRTSASWPRSRRRCESDPPRGKRDPTVNIDKLVVVGVGLIGGSFALALRKADAVRRVVGVGRSAQNLERARERGIVDHAVTLDGDWATQTRDADVVLLATPVAQFGELLRALARSWARIRSSPTPAAPSRTSASRRVPRSAAHSPASYPRTRSRAASAPAPTPPMRSCSTSGASSSRRCAKRIQRRWRSSGRCGRRPCARVSELTPGRHDRVLAAVSHLPHLLAFAFVDEIAAREDAAALFAHAGSGLRDFTRIAASSPEMWRDIALANRPALLAELDLYRGALDAVVRALEQGDGAALEAMFARAAAGASRVDGQRIVSARQRRRRRPEWPSPPPPPWRWRRCVRRRARSRCPDRKASQIARCSSPRSPMALPTLHGLLAADDTARMLEALAALGVRIDHDAATATARVEGCGRSLPRGARGPVPR